MKTEIDILNELISIPSQIGIDKEKNVALFLCKLLRKYSFDIEVYEFAKDRPNIMATYTFDQKGPTIIFNGHMDTMPFINGQKEEEWNTIPNKATLIDGKIYGRGACDMKGGIASALAAIFKCIEEKTGTGRIVVCLVSDEENTSLYGMIPLCEKKLLSGDFAIVMEPTECCVCSKQLGNMFFKTYIQGRGGHTGRPESKINPFEISIEYVQRLKQWIKTKRENENDLQPFINIGHYDGGTSSGTIPSYCELYWGTRVMPNDSFDSYMKEIMQLTEEFKKCIPYYSDLKSELIESGGIDSFKCKSKFIDKLVELSGKSEDTFTASSDAGFIANMLGIDAVVFGPGSLEQAHVSNEYVKVSDLESCKEILYKFLISVGEGYE